MAGKLIKRLDKNDLVYILADYFEVDVKAVSLLPSIVTEGSGMSEHDVATVTAEVDITDSDLI